MRVLAVLLGAVLAAEFQITASTGANPIRRIVNLLQNMQKEIGDEQARDKDLNEKFACYCQKNDGELSAGLDELRAKIPQIEASITEAVSLKQQLDDELAQHKADRTNAKGSIESATAQREKEAADFAAESTELKSNIASCKSASDAIAKGMAAMFLQSGAANTLRQLVLVRSMDRYKRDTLTSFLSATTEYAPASGEIVGILRTLQEEMEADLKSTTEAENAGISEFEGLVAAKNKEIQAATEAIESKTERAGETAVQIVSLKNDLEDTKDSLGADEVFLMQLKKDCATKGGEYEERQKNRADELVAVAETIKVLNDDDALDLFKKTLPSPALLQVTGRARDVRKDAIRALRKANAKTPTFNFITLALEGKKVGFEKVIKLIDDLVTKLGSEQGDDDAQLKWCNKEFDQSEDTQKDLKRRLEGLSAAIEETKEAISTVTDELAALAQGIKDLDQQVADATQQRQAEHAAFVQTSSENNAAVQLLGVAKNRLNKFYNPALYKAPQRRELTDEERIFVNSGGADPRDAEEAAAPKGIGGTGITVMQTGDAPAPPPETMGAYQKRDSSGPIALIDKLANDLEKEVLANEKDEQQGQKDYEEFMGDSVAKRAADSKSITEKNGQKAGLEGDLQAAKDGHKSTAAELQALGEYIAQLHGSCDFLVENFDLRKEARANEIDALKKAKAVLSGADFSLMQLKAGMKTNMKMFLSPRRS